MSTAIVLVLITIPPTSIPSSHLPSPPVAPCLPHCQISDEKLKRKKKSQNIELGLSLARVEPSSLSAGGKHYLSMEISGGVGR